MVTNGRTTWTAGERIRVYRATRGRAGLVVEADDEDAAADPDGRRHAAAARRRRARAPARGPVDPKIAEPLSAVAFAAQNRS